MKILKSWKTWQKISLLIALLGGGIGAGYYILSGFPEYAMLQITKSVDRHNWHTFTKFIDVDQVLNEAFDAKAELELHDDSIRHINDSTYQTLFSREFAAMIKPLEVNELRSEVKHYIEEGKFQNSAPVKLSDRSIYAYKKAFDEYSNYSGFSKLLKNDSIAVFQLNFHTQKKNSKAPNKEFSVQIRFVRQSHLWKMKGIQNIKEVLKALDEIKSSGKI